MLLEPTIDALTLPRFGKRSQDLPDAGERDAQRLSGIYVDGTFGRGGHSRALLARLGPRPYVFGASRAILVNWPPHKSCEATAVARARRV